MIFFMAPMSKDYLEKHSVQELVHLIKTQKMLKELLFKRAELLASIKKMKIEEDIKKISEGGAKSTLQQIATSSKTLIHEDELKENKKFGLRGTRIIKFKVDNMPKLYGNDRMDLPNRKMKG